MLATLTRTAALTILALVCQACGGHVGGVTESIDMVPKAATVQVNGTQELTVAFLETAPNQITWSVVEPGGGTVVPGPQSPPTTAVYTAPASPGVYHVRAHVVTNSREKTVECVMTVVP